MEDQEVGGRDPAEDFAVGAVGAGGVQGLQDLGHRGVVHAQGARARRTLDGLGRSKAFCVLTSFAPREPTATLFPGDMVEQ